MLCARRPNFGSPRTPSISSSCSTTCATSSSRNRHRSKNHCFRTQSKAKARKQKAKNKSLRKSSKTNENNQRRRQTTQHQFTVLSCSNRCRTSLLLATTLLWQEWVTRAFFGRQQKRTLVPCYPHTILRQQLLSWMTQCKVDQINTTFLNTQERKVCPRVPTFSDVRSYSKPIDTRYVAQSPFQRFPIMRLNETEHPVS